MRSSGKKRVSLTKISGILFAAAGISAVVFAVSVPIVGANENPILWRIFSVCMPITGICIAGGTATAIAARLKK